MKPRTPLAERYWAKVDKNGPVMRPELGPCWEWKGAKKEWGYGVIGRGGRGEGLIRATHVSWEIHTGGPVPPGMELLHRCDNPPCSNPAHLLLGTRAENVADMVSKRRHAHGECSYSKLTEQQVIEVLTSPEAGNVIAKRLNVSTSLVSAIRRGERWKHLRATVAA